eukprot:5077612-Alexandrium_andersonii.AAC.1
MVQQRPVVNQATWLDGNTDVIALATPGVGRSASRQARADMPEQLPLWHDAAQHGSEHRPA